MNEAFWKKKEEIKGTTHVEDEGGGKFQEQEENVDSKLETGVL